MLRIAHILGKTHDSDAEHTVMNYYRAVDRNEIQFDFFLCKGSEYLPAEEIKELGGRIFVLPPAVERARYIRVLQQLLSENSYDIVHCHQQPLAAISLKVAKDAGVKNRILHCHDGAKKAGSAKKYATGLLADCESNARKCFGAMPVCALNEEAPPVTVARTLPAAVDVSKYRSSSSRNIRKRLNIPDSSLVFGCVGELCSKNNQGFLIDVFKEILNDNKNSVLVIAGKGKDSEFLKARITTSGVSDRIIMLHRATEELYSAFDCFLLPQKKEGFPFAAVEAQAADLYCIFSDRVNRSAKLTDSAQFLSLKAGFSDWACAALCCARLRNKKSAEQLKTAGYDITECAKELQKYYLTLRES